MGIWVLARIVLKVQTMLLVGSPLLRKISITPTLKSIVYSIVRVPLQKHAHFLLTARSKSLTLPSSKRKLLLRSRWRRINLASSNEVHMKDQLSKGHFQGCRFDNLTQRHGERCFVGDSDSDGYRCDSGQLIGVKTIWANQQGRRRNWSSLLMTR